MLAALMTGHHFSISARRKRNHDRDGMSRIRLRMGDRPGSRKHGPIAAASTRQFRKDGLLSPTTPRYGGYRFWDLCASMLCLMKPATSVRMPPAMAPVRP